MELIPMLWTLFMAYITYAMGEIRGGPVGWTIVVVGWVILVALLIMI